jgi:anti-sigma regulatory factor (Ser/Thr protein kinase)
MPADRARDLALELPATSSGLRDGLTSIEEACNGWGISRDDVSRLRVVVEELFTNTIKYGYGGECERPVRITLRCSPHIELVYEDQAPPFDPTAWRAPSEPAAAGRQGIALVRGLSKSVRYERLPTGNRVTLRFG